MAKYLVGSDGKIAARIVEPEEEKGFKEEDLKKAYKPSPETEKEMKKKQAKKALGKAISKAWNAIASFRARARKALKK